MAAGGPELMMTFARVPGMAVRRRVSLAHLRLAVLSIAFAALAGCASLNTTLDRVNQGWPPSPTPHAADTGLDHNRLWPISGVRESDDA